MSFDLELDELYRDLILDHYRNPRNRAPLTDGDVTAEGYNPLCGDEVAMELKFDGDRIAAIGLHGRGCSISQASGSMMTEAVKGRSVSEVRDIIARFKKMMTEPEAEPPDDLGDLEALQGVARFPVRVKCATLAWHTLEDGLRQREAGLRRVSHVES